MPHLTLEYSANLADQTDMTSLCGKLAQALAAIRLADSQVYKTGGIRVRALACHDYCIADGQQADAAFVHGCLRIGGGRTQETLTATGDALFAVMQAHFAELFEARGLALSFVIDEFAPPGSWKLNNLHQRFNQR